MKKKEQSQIGKAVQLRGGWPESFGLLDRIKSLGGGEAELYRAMRDSVPLLDAAVGKLVRLTGGFDVGCADKAAEAGLRQFLRTVPIGRGQFGIESFLSAYLDSLLTYGRAVGEMVVADGQFLALCWGDVRKVHVREGDSPLDFVLGVYENGEWKPLPYQQLLLLSTREPEPGNVYGVSLFRGMPFLTDVLLKIYNTIGVNWERAGNVRYSVVYKPQDGAAEPGAAEQMAKEWSAAMQESRGGSVRDFVAVGDVQIKVIGADGKILDSAVPVKQILEQLVTKTGLPPFLLGLSWSATERMAAQQADLLTSELWSIRRSVQPVLEHICRCWLRLNGFGCDAKIIWDDISLQDIVEQSRAELYRAQAEKIRKEMEETV